MPDLILASNSVTRRNMLMNAGVSFEAKAAMIDEEAIKDSLLQEGIVARDLADQLADLKARSLSQIYPGAYIIGSDQILEKDGRVFSKGNNISDAKEKLKILQNGKHSLFSAAVVYYEGKAIWRFVDEARLTMRPLSEEFIDQYLIKAGNSVFSSVGCYQIEGLGIQLFSKVEGSHFTILGMPLLPLLDFLRLHRLTEI
jgi:septum formation protein